MMEVVSESQWLYILASFLNEPTCFNLTASTVRFLNWQTELSILMNVVPRSTGNTKSGTEN